MYATFNEVPTSCLVFGGPSQQGSVDRLYRGVSTSAGGITWTLKTATTICTTAADCCENSNCSCLDPTTGNDCRGGTCKCYPDADCGKKISLQVDPTQANTVAFGNTKVFRSTNGGQSARQLASGTIHDDVNAFAFLNHDTVLVGSDGGVWMTTNFSAATPTWTSLNNNLENLEFYESAGAIDPLNYGVSAGGTQDNGDLKGGTPLTWTFLGGGDGGLSMMIDPTNSNVLYIELSALPRKSTDGGASFVSKISGLPLDPPTGSPNINPLAMDPLDSRTLVAFSVPDRKVYRTTSGMEPQPPNPAWQAISQALTGIGVAAFAFAPGTTPPSNTIFAATGGQGIWGTTNPPTWSRIDQASQLPARPLTSIAIDTSKQCQVGTQLCSSSCPCTMYVTAALFNSSGGPAGHVFRSIDSGHTWGDIGAGVLPDVPANKIVIHPGCPNMVYVATDMGIFQGTLSDGTCGTANTGTWSWCPYTQLPQLAARSNEFGSERRAKFLKSFGVSLATRM